MDGGDGDKGGGALVEKGRGRDKLEWEGDKVEHQKNSSATHAAHAHGDADEEEDNEEGHTADDNVGDIGEGMRRGEAWDAAFHGDAEHPMALYVYPSIFSHSLTSRGDKRCHSSCGMVIVTAEGQGREQRKRETKKLSQRRAWCLDARIWYLPKQKYPAQLMDMWVLSGNNEDMKSASYTLARAIQGRHLVVFYNCSLVNYAEPSSPSTGGVEEPTVSIGYTTMPAHLIGAMDEEQADLADALCLPWWWALEVIPWKYHAQREGDEEWLTGTGAWINFGRPRHIPHQHISLKVHRSAKVHMEVGRVGPVAMPRRKGEGDTGKKGAYDPRAKFEVEPETESTFRSVEARLPTPPSQHRTQETTVPVVVDLHTIECIVGRVESSMGMSGELLTAVVTLPGLFSWNQKSSLNSKLRCRYTSVVIL
ncbi:hypothetical protein JB92DRAFT_2828148 [Gautieria morchelliformis]|nr:hypothetical protein JB92DRAFT_2828148 [Gautieria morchelliformis]